MKKLARLLLLSLLLLITVSCSSTVLNRTLLLPRADALERKLPYLENLNKGDSGNNSVNEASYLYTIWERELRANIMDESTEKKGTIEITEVFSNNEKNAMQTREYLSREYEITISDMEGRTVWNRSYYKEETVKLSWWQPSRNNDKRANTENQIMKDVIEAFKKDVTREYEKITSDLK